MKHNIIICCEMMLRAIGNKDVVVTTEGVGPTYSQSVFKVTIRERSGNRIECCPWCATELPFPYEERE